MPERPDSPIRPTDAQARTLALKLMREARFCALGVLEPRSGAPMVSRVAFGLSPKGTPLTFISALSNHTAALTANAACSVLVGELDARGDPLTHPRLTLQCHAEFVANDTPERTTLRAAWLESHPKAKLYIDFGDFRFVTLRVSAGFLNGGFGKAYALEPEDLGL